MSSSYLSISLIKQSNMPRQQLAIFLLNISKEALCDFLNKSTILDKPHNLTKNKMIEFIINCNILRRDNETNTITSITERIRIDNA